MVNIHINQRHYTKTILRAFLLILCAIWMIGIPECVFFVRTAECAKAELNRIHAVRVDKDIHLDAALEGAFNKEITEAVTSGAPTRFRFHVRIMKKRGLWFDKEIEEFTFYHTVTYDVLKKEYMATKSYPNGSEENLSTADWGEMVQWMSKLADVQLSVPNLKDQKATYYLRIRAEMKCIKIPFPLNYLLAFVALWNFDTPWARTPLEVDSKKSDMIEQALIDNDK